MVSYTLRSISTQLVEGYKDIFDRERKDSVGLVQTSDRLLKEALARTP